MQAHRDDLKESIYFKIGTKQAAYDMLRESDTFRQGAYDFCTSTIADASQDFFVNPAEEYRSRLVAA
jgi:hypothetical protein